MKFNEFPSWTISLWVIFNFQLSNWSNRLRRPESNQWISRHVAQSFNFQVRCANVLHMSVEQSFQYWSFSFNAFFKRLYPVKKPLWLFMEDQAWTFSVNFMTKCFTLKDLARLRDHSKLRRLSGIADIPAAWTLGIGKKLLRIRNNWNYTLITL